MTSILSSSKFNLPLTPPRERPLQAPSHRVLSRHYFPPSFSVSIRVVVYILLALYPHVFCEDIGRVAQEFSFVALFDENLSENRIGVPPLTDPQSSHLTPPLCLCLIQRALVHFSTLSNVSGVLTLCFPHPLLPKRYSLRCLRAAGLSSPPRLPYFESCVRFATRPFLRQILNYPRPFPIGFFPEVAGFRPPKLSPVSLA